MMKHIKLDMRDYKLRQKGKCALTREEKIARIYQLADQLHVQIGKEKKP